MKSIYTLISLSLLLSLSACGAPAQLPMQLSRNPIQAQSQPQSDPRLFETFKGFLNHSAYDNSGLAEMLMTARSMLGKTYDNRNSATRYHMFYRKQSSFLATAHGPIRLGRDNALYLEDMNFVNGQKQMLYYRLGTYSLAAGSRDGQEVRFELAPGNSVKMKWRGINPMNHDEIHLTIDPAIKPVQKDKSELL
ncbi:MAG: hypothetical protein CVV27_07520 [Candidatus Melainabacteria bacterium HGW-Melainabacteria-1]|nr:MAG: hypothetical protein CVV27_07520 [Candidatus Melainabacteria bacterium HGW-Melainabacteria-1]